MDKSNFASTCKKILVSIGLFLCFSVSGKAQVLVDTFPKAQLNLDIDAFSLDAGYAFKVDKKLMMGVGVGIGLGYTQLFIDEQGDRVFDLLHARLFFGNQQLKKGFSWESGIMGSIIGIGDDELGGIGFIGNLYFRPYFGNKKWKIGTQVGFGFSGGDGGPLWTPVLIRYTIHYPKTKK